MQYSPTKIYLSFWTQLKGQPAAKRPLEEVRQEFILSTMQLPSTLCSVCMHLCGLYPKSNKKASQQH